ncbi:Glucose-methanol-choline oxidoreductase family protein [Perilla frutescens var. hirtella]|uniref:Glucose-methanol-choline oxidoreductase family protein n=1 Tax=Perilla frutescens var. hirtella TaxID=608512 RepID=A0AAD4J546_PERFH|nr:Glucose-methanol-choline oxidoreductase family protein [Perilla frutescens var. hirtella]
MAASGDGAVAAESGGASGVDDFEMGGGGNRWPRQDTSDTLSSRAVWNIEMKCGSATDDGFYTHTGSEYVRNVGWDPVLVNESCEWVERKVVFRPGLTQWQTAVRDGCTIFPLELGHLLLFGFWWTEANNFSCGLLLSLSCQRGSGGFWSR